MVSKQSFFCIYSRSSPLTLPPEPSGKTRSGLPLILYYGELYNYFIIYHNITMIEIKGTINVMLFESSPNYPPCPSPIHRTVFHETSPLCKKVVVDSCFKVQNVRKFLVLLFSGERVLLRTPRTPTTGQGSCNAVPGALRDSSEHPLHFSPSYSCQPIAICYLLSIDQKLLVPSYFGPFYYIINNSPSVLYPPLR